MQVPERQSTVYFENVRVSADRVVGRIDHGMKAAFAGINAERLLVSSICTGVGRYALDKAVRTRTSVPYGAYRSAVIRASRTRWLNRRSHSSPLA